MKKLFLIIGVVLLVAAGIWQFALKNQFNNRLNPDWRWDINTLGNSGYADEETGEFEPNTSLANDPISLTVRNISVNEVLDDNVLEIVDHYETRDPSTDEVTWEFDLTTNVNATTGKHAEEEFADDYYMFPRNTQKTTYNIRNSSYQGLPMEFTREEEVAGINTYVFEYNDDLENSASYFGFVELEEGQQIICPGFEMAFWVEPRTGEILKYREWCEGDYLYDEDGSVLYGLQRWGGETTGDDLIRRAEVVREAINRHNWINLYTPILLLVLGIAGIGYGIVPTNNTENNGTPA